MKIKYVSRLDLRYFFLLLVFNLLHSKLSFSFDYCQSKNSMQDLLQVEELNGISIKAKDLIQAGKIQEAIWSLHEEKSWQQAQFLKKYLPLYS